MWPEALAFHESFLSGHDLPPEVSWLSFFILFLLGASALFDARTGRVPDTVTLFGFLVTVGGYGFFADWTLAAQRLAAGFGVIILLYALNRGYARCLNQDAFGMGDAKWSGLAFANFGLLPVVSAWVVGAWLGILWMTALWIYRRFRPASASSARATTGAFERVHFAPFLFFGLLAGLYLVHRDDSWLPRELLP